MVAVGMGLINDFSQQEEEKALAAAQRLVSLGADVNAATSTGWTPAHAAAYIGANRLTEWLWAHQRDCRLAGRVMAFIHRRQQADILRGVLADKAGDGPLAALEPARAAGTGPPAG